MIVTSCVGFVCQWVHYVIFGNFILFPQNASDSQVSFIALAFSFLGIQCGWFCGNNEFAVNGATWYISVLMICYAIFILCEKIKTWWCCSRYTTYISFVLLGIYLYLHNPDFPLLYFNCGRGYMMFFSGAILGNFLNTQSVNLKQSKKYALYTLLGLILFMISNRLNLFGDWLLFNLVVLLPLFGFLIMEDRLEHLFNSDLVKYLSNISYDIYLWNVPYFMFIKTLSEYGILEFFPAKISHYFTIYAGLLLVSVISNNFKNFYINRL